MFEAKFWQLNSRHQWQTTAKKFGTKDSSKIVGKGDIKTLRVQNVYFSRTLRYFTGRKVGHKTRENSWKFHASLPTII